MAMDGEDWGRVFADIPIITKIYTGATLLITLACNFEFISQFQLYLNPYLIVKRFEIWRLLTPFLYAGPFSFGTLFNLLFTYRYSRILEETCFLNRRADYVFMLVLVAAIILFLALPLTDMVFLGNALSHSILYLWCRRNPMQRVMIFGLLVLRADQVHFVLLALSVLTGSSLTSDLIAVFAGHLYFFLEDVFPKQRLGFRILKTPRFLKALFNELEEDPSSANQVPMENIAQVVDENNNLINEGFAAAPALLHENANAMQPAPPPQLGGALVH